MLHSIIKPDLDLDSPNNISTDVYDLTRFHRIVILFCGTLIYLKHGVKNVKVTNVQYYIVLTEKYRCKVHILLPLMIFRQNTLSHPPTPRFYDTLQRTFCKQNIKPISQSKTHRQLISFRCKI